MNLFAGLKSQVQPSFDSPKAVMTIVIAAVAADGNVSGDEIGHLRSMCARSPIFGANSREEDNALIDFAATVTTQFGDAAIARAAEALTPELRETAFAFATEMIFADSIIGPDEEQFLTQLAETLGISEDLARAIIVVTMIRARSE